MKIDCKFWYQCGWDKESECNDDCRRFEPDIHSFDCKCSNCDVDRGDYLYHFKKEMGEFD